ncbi:hypothetical protein QOZ80_3BG0278330 [Eleusine coracana subsp. coracana]|nr:hypothetical protein QOZ80_3BG0278330 [Eleusine coracana subsp. coracana]
METSEGKAEGNSKCEWTPTMSTFMLTYLAEVVANGTKTSSGFKKVHLNACARALNEHFKVGRTGDQIGNHLRTWKRKYTKMNKLRKDHKGDDEYLNKPLEHYSLMATIFGNSVATGQYVKGSNDPLVVDVEDIDDDGNGGTTTADDNGASSSATRPYKRAKIAETEDAGLIGALKNASDTLATAIVKAAIVANELPPNLFENVTILAGFDDTHKAYYYSHLVANPREARAFNDLPYNYKLIFMAKYISEHFPGC